MHNYKAKLINHHLLIKGREREREREQKCLFHSLHQIIFKIICNDSNVIILTALTVHLFVTTTDKVSVALVQFKPSSVIVYSENTVLK